METVVTALQAILPQQLLSRLVGKLAQLEKPVWLKNFLIRTFMARYDIDLTEATCSSGEDFPHFNACFTRSLREGMRPLVLDSHGARRVKAWGRFYARLSTGLL